MKLITTYDKICVSFSYEVIFLKKFISLISALALCFSVFTVSPRAKASSVIEGAGRVNTASTSLNVRVSPSSSATVKTTLSRNSYVTILSTSGKYLYVQYSATGYGYCHSDYIYRVSSAVRYVKTTSGNLRVRSTPSTTGTIVSKLPSGTAVTVHSVTDDFARIIYSGNKTGYVNKNYLTHTAPTTTYKAINLKVPDYKQTDSRWANVTLGNSGQTISKIGCATTALAMTESYRTGTTIYPDAMAKRLSYTSGGAVYWPSGYTTVTSSSGYLETIYKNLSAGKPVIVGAKNSYGGQHYVVVTGIKSTNTLTTSSFYINDPGSASRTTLSQFLSAYPYFYKMLWAK